MKRRVDDSLAAIKERDANWRAKQAKWGTGSRISTSNAARGARDRVILLSLLEDLRERAPSKNTAIPAKADRDCATVLLCMAAVLGTDPRAAQLEELARDSVFAAPEARWLAPSVWIENNFPTPENLSFRERAAITIFANRDYMKAPVSTPIAEALPDPAKVGPWFTLDDEYHDRNNPQRKSRLHLRGRHLNDAALCDAALVLNTLDGGRTEAQCEGPDRCTRCLKHRAAQLVKLERRALNAHGGPDAR